MPPLHSSLTRDCTAFCGRDARLALHRPVGHNKHKHKKQGSYRLESSQAVTCASRQDQEQEVDFKRSNPKTDKFEVHPRTCRVCDMYAAWLN